MSLVFSFYLLCEFSQLTQQIRNTGFAILEGDALKSQALDYGVISIPQKIRQSAALAAISTGVGNLIKKWEPDVVTVEAIIYVQSTKTAISCLLYTSDAADD